MSWQIFKDNILSRANSPEGIQTLDEIAELYATEYDAAIKRGGDTINHIPIVKGNVDSMKELFKLAFQQGASSTTPYDLVGNMDKGVLAYWQSAELNKAPIPVIPAVGSTINVSITYATCTNPGQWTPGAPATKFANTPSTPDEIEEQAIEEDHKEFKKNHQIYRELFQSDEEANNNNSNVTPKEAISNITKFNEIKSQTSGNAGTSGNFPQTPKPTMVGRGDEALFKKCGNGEWPALGQPGNFKVDSSENTGAKCTAPIRYWYKVNEKYLSKNCTQISFPTVSGDKKIMVHKDLAALIKPALSEIKSSGLYKYILSCDGGMAVRNVTCGSRFSNHSWGTAIDMNASVYPYGTKFGTDGVYSGKTKLRSFTAFDTGFLQVAQIFKKYGMTWLSNNDPMHISIYE
jgi:hypothetical protein